MSHRGCWPPALQRTALSGKHVGEADLYTEEMLSCAEMALPCYGFVENLTGLFTFLFFSSAVSVCAQERIQL